MPTFDGIYIPVERPHNCPECEGSGTVQVRMCHLTYATHHPTSCNTCEGRGKITEEHFQAIALGKQLRDLRHSKGYRLTDIAKEVLTEPAWMFLEQGKAPLRQIESAMKLMRKFPINPIKPYKDVLK